jgi:hypothetical protein
VQLQPKLLDRIIKKKNYWIIILELPCFGLAWAVVWEKVQLAEKKRHLSWTYLCVWNATKF